MMSQYAAPSPFNQGTSTAGFSGYSTPTPMYGMPYSGTQNMMNSQFGATAAYPQGFSANTGFTGAMPAANGVATETSRTIYLGNVPREAEPNDILKYVKTGMVESLKIMPEKGCAFLAFVDPTSAHAFYSEFHAKKLTVHNSDLRLGWGKAAALPAPLRLAIHNGATRNVYLGSLDESVTEEGLRTDLSRFGQIEQVKIIREKNIGFVHFTSISAALKCVSTLPQEPAWSTRRVYYGKDRCAYSGAGSDAHYGGGNMQTPFGGNFGFDPYSSMMMNQYSMRNPSVTGANVLRTLYIGNIHPEATCEDLCNSIRGGNLLQVRYFPEKHIAFVSFMDAPTAITVYNHANFNGIVVKGRRLRVGWGKPSPIASNVLLGIQSGATRNIYVGGIEEDVTEEKLRSDFAEFGEIELINTLREKSCAFVNFTSVQSAMSALAGIKEKPGYSKYKINYGKDRCGNPFKQVFRNNDDNKSQTAVATGAATDAQSTGDH
jgi:RNA recognition motif-containing protein